MTKPNGDETTAEQPIDPLELDQASDSSRPRRPLNSIMQSLSARLPCDDDRVRLDGEAEKCRRQRIVTEMISHAGKEFRNYTLNRYRDKTSDQRKAKSAVVEWWQSFPERLERREGMVLYGPVGTGKDHLAFGAVAAAVMEFGCSAAYRNGRDLMAEMRDRIGGSRHESSLIDGLAIPDVLIVSDPLPVRGELSDFQADFLYRLIDARSASGLVTVCTLNVADDEEADRRLGAATWDRLCDKAWKIACFWQSYRQPVRKVGGS